MEKIYVMFGTLMFIFVSMTARAAGFDASYYASRYPDVVAVVGNSPDALYNHYVTFGIKEHRFQNKDEELGITSSNFDAAYYASKYPDVVKALGTDPNVLYNHYMTYGKNEHRFKNKSEEGTSTPAPTNNQNKVVNNIIPGYSTYVDVDITNQIVTYYENGEVKLQTPCVSGNESAGRSTPKGTYQIISHVNGKYLVGPTWRCWVNKWMQFTPNHIGLHDASWRSEFGGEIYKTSGSHGCVNLPKEAASTLFDLTSVGTTVVVH